MSVNSPRHDMRLLLKGGFFWGGYLLCLFLLGGLIAHKSYSPVWLGRYSKTYFLLIVLVFLAVLFWKPLCSFLLRPTVWNGSKRVIHITARCKLGWCAALFFGVLLSGEIYIRLHNPWIREPDPRLVAKYHPYLQNDLVAGDNQLHVNAEGFRGDSIPSRDNRDLLIFMLGGSTMLSHDVPYEKSHAALFEREIQKKYPDLRISVQNAGNEWHTSLHSVIKYITRIRAYDPDLIIMWHGINDLCRSFGPNRFTPENAEYRSDYKHYHGPIAGMFSYYKMPVRRPPFMCSALLSWLADSLYSDLRSSAAVREDALTPVEVHRFASTTAFEGNMNALLILMTADQVTVVVASEPSVYRKDLTGEQEQALWMQKSLCRMGSRYPDTESLMRGMGEFNDVSRTLAERHGVYFLDLDQSVPKEPAYMFDDCHYTIEGNQVVAKTVTDFVVANRLIERAVAQKQIRSRQTEAEP